MATYISTAQLNKPSFLDESDRSTVVGSIDELQGLLGDDTATDGLSLEQLLELHKKLSDELQSQLSE